MTMHQPDSYRSKREQFIAFIRQHTFAGNKLPKEAEIARITGMSLGSTRELLRYMESKGDITKKPAYGNFINYSSIKAKLRIDCNEDFLDLIAETGRKPGLRKGDVCPVDPSQEAFVRTHFLEKMKDSLDLVQMDMTYCGDTQPLVYALFFFPGNTSLVSSEKTEGPERYWDYYKRYYHHSLIELVPAVCDETIARQLGLPAGTPLLVFSEIHYDGYDEIICVSKSYFEPQVMKLTMVRK